MRTRITNSDQLQVCQVRSTNLVTGALGYATMNTEVNSANTRIFEDQVTPNFAARRAHGEIIINPMTSAESSIVGDSAIGYTLRNYHTSDNSLAAAVSLEVIAGSLGRYYTPGPSIASRYFSGPTGRDTINAQFGMAAVDSVASSTLARCLSRAASSDALALVTLAELNKTLSLYSDLAKQATAFNKVIARMTDVDKKFLRKANLRDMKRSALLSAQAWLAYRYGIMATYYDMMSWVEARNSIGKPRRARFVSTATSDYDSGLSTSSITTTWEVGNFAERRKRFTRTSSGCIVGFELDGSVTQSYGILHILSSGWELVPYSFVLDWFVDIGERIAALEGKFLQPVLGSWTTHRHSLYEYRSARYDGRRYTEGSFIYDSLGMNNYGNRSETCEIVTRSANPTLSALPQFKVNLNWKRLADSIALLSLASKKAKGYK